MPLSICKELLYEEELNGCGHCLVNRIDSRTSLVGNKMMGNPISHALASKAAKEYVAEQFPDSDYHMERITYNFKDSKYHAFMVSPTIIPVTRVSCLMN